jgi:sarcosine oxidase subunit beta
MREGVQVWEQLSAELNYNVMFTQRGAFIVAGNQAQLEFCKELVNLHKSCGINTRLLSSAEAMRLVPCFNEREVIGGIFDAKGGIARHDAVVWAYAKAASGLGVSIYPQTEVQAIGVDDGRVKSVKTSQGKVHADIVVNAAGGDSKHVAQMVGVELPTYPVRWEAIVTEPIKPYLNIYVRWPKAGLYVSQTSRGEIAAGIDSHEAPSTELRCSLAFVKRLSKALLSLFPSLERLAVLRQWAGLISITDDGCPILGPIPEVEGFLLDCGWYIGFMTAPIVGRMLARSILEQKTPKLIEPFKCNRFAEGKPISEGSTAEKMTRLARSEES